VRTKPEQLLAKRHWLTERVILLTKSRFIYYKVRTCTILVLVAAGALQPANANIPIYGYWDWNMYSDTVDDGLIPSLDYVNYGNVRSLYEIQKHAYEGRRSFMFLQYFPPTNPYYIEELFTNLLDAIGQFTEPNDLAYIQISDESYLHGLTKAEAETMIAHAKSRLPGYKFAMSFGGLMSASCGPPPEGNGANAEAKGGFPDNLDIAMLNWAPFAADSNGSAPENKSEFDALTQVLLDKYMPLTGPNTKLMFTTGIYLNQTDPYDSLPTESAAWYAEWVDDEPNIIGMILYSWYGSPGEYSGKWLEENVGGYVATHTQVGRDWGITTSFNPPAPNYPALPSSFDRQKWNTSVGHEGWDSQCGATQWMGVFGDTAHSGVQALRIRNTNQQGNLVSRPVPTADQVHGELDMYMAVTNLAGQSYVQVGLFPGYTNGRTINGINGYVSGTQTLLLLVEPQTSSNYILFCGNNQKLDTGFPITGCWDHIEIEWNVDGIDSYSLWVNDEGPVTVAGSLYGYNVSSIRGIRIFAAADNSLPNDPYAYSPPVGLEIWLDDVDITFEDVNYPDVNCPNLYDTGDSNEEFLNTGGFYEDWQDCGSALYPDNWYHSGAGTPGSVTDDAGVEGSKAMQVTGESSAFDGYSRYFTPLNEGELSFSFTINTPGECIHITDFGGAGFSPRLQLGNGTAAYDTYTWIGGGYDVQDTGITLPAPGQWHTIIYRWFADNTDELIINGQDVPIPAGWVSQNHRAWGGSSENDLLIPEGFRFGVARAGTVATWDNITVTGIYDGSVCDLDESNAVNFRDFNIFTDKWLKDNCAIGNWCSGADLDRDLDVDSTDLVVFVNNWLWAR